MSSERLALDKMEQQLEARLGRVHARQRLGSKPKAGIKYLARGLTFFIPKLVFGTRTDPLRYPVGRTVWARPAQRA